MSDAPNTPSSPTPGATTGTSARIQQIGGFELITKVGQGAMGTVFKARQTSLDRIVALKVLPPKIATDATFIERFQREARASAKLNHQNIVQGIDVGKDAASGLWYFAMEFVDGPTLKQVLEQQKVLPERRALELVRDVAKALEAVAANNMVHRDIKPDNILITSRGETKLADLGLARETKEDASLTQSGKAVGTPFYMAPEQVRGQMDQIDIRTDIYALGATLFHLVTGTPPFTGATSALIMSMHLTEAPPKANKVNPEVSDACSRMIDKMMQKKPELRYQSPTDLVRQIERVISREATGEARPITAQVAPLEMRRRSTEDSPVRSRSGALAGIAALLLVGVVVFLMKGSGGKPETAVASKEPEKAPVAAPVVAPDKTPMAKPPDVNAGKKRKAEAPAVVAKKGPEAPVVPAAVPKADDAVRLFEQAQELEQKTPAAFDDILASYDKASKVANADLKEKIEDAMSATQQRQTSAANEAWKAIEEKVAAASEAGDYDAALAVLNDIPKSFGATLTERAAARAAAVNQEAEGKVNSAVKRIEEFAQNAEPAEGLKVLEELEQIKYARTQATLAALKAKLNDDLENADTLKAKRQTLLAEKRLDEVLQKFDLAMLEPGTKAQEIANEARRDPVLAPLKPKVEAMAQIAAAVDEVAKLVQQSLEKMKGQKVELETKTGKLAGKVGRIQDGTVYLEIDFGGGAVGTKAVKLADLTEEQRRTFSGSIAASTDAQRVAAAIAKMAKGKEDLGAAIALLAQSQDFPLTQYYQEKFMRRQAEAAKAATEAAAGPAWADIYSRTLPAKLSEPEAKLALEKIAKFEKDYGTTQFAAAIKEKIVALKERLGRMALVNVVKNGDFEAGTAQYWEIRDKAAKMEATAVEPHSGRAALQVAFNRTVLPEQTVETEPGAQYKFKLWIRVDKVTRSFRSRTRFYDGKDLVLVTPSLDITTPKSDWQLVEALVTAPGKSLRIEIMLRTNSDGETMNAYMDDIELVRIEPTRLGNPSMK